MADVIGATTVFSYKIREFSVLFKICGSFCCLSKTLGDQSKNADFFVILKSLLAFCDLQF